MMILRKNAWMTISNGLDGKKLMIKLHKIMKILVIQIHLLHSGCVLAKISRMLAENCIGINITRVEIVRTF